MGALAVILVLAAIVLTVMTLYRRMLFSDAICLPLIEKWAAQEGVMFEQDEVDGAFPDYGPFLLRSTRVQKIYRLAVTRSGQKHIVYVRCGHWLLGLLRSDLTVRWKEEPNQAPEPTAPSGRGSP